MIKNNKNITLQESVLHNSIQLHQQWKLNKENLTVLLDYPIKGTSSLPDGVQINIQESKRFFSSATLSQKPNLIIYNAQFITGFTDGEACFNLSISKDNTFKLGWRVKLTFIISLHSRDKEVL